MNLWNRFRKYSASSQLNSRGQKKSSNGVVGAASHWESWHTGGERIPPPGLVAAEMSVLSEYNPVRIATAHIIQAMALYRLGEVEKAISELGGGRKPGEVRIRQGGWRKVWLGVVSGTLAFCCAHSSARGGGVD